jgi:hypothetical protein
VVEGFRWPALCLLFDIRDLNICKNIDSAELSFVFALDAPEPAILIEVHNRCERLEELLLLLLMTEVAAVDVWVRELMQRKYVHTAYAFEAIHGYVNILGLSHVLKGKVLADASRSGPEKLVRFRQRQWPAEDFINEIIERFLKEVRVDSRIEIGF